MSSNATNLRRQILALTERFVLDVLAAIEEAPLEQLTAVLPKGKRKRPASIATAPDGDDVRASDNARFARRSHDEIERLREKILRALRDAGRPLPAAEIAREAGVKTADLAFPMAQLRTLGMVDKNGDRTQAVYRLLKGAAHVRDIAADADAPDRGKKKKKKTKR